MKGNVRETVFDASLANNATASAFETIIPATVDMTELNRNEKYKYLDTNCPPITHVPVLSRQEEYCSIAMTV